MGRPLTAEFLPNGTTRVHTDYLDSAAFCRYPPCRLLVDKDPTRFVLIYRHQGDDNPEHRLEVTDAEFVAAVRAGGLVPPLVWLNRVHEYEAQEAKP